MKTITINVQPDHLAALTVARNPLRAVAELIWNGLDADAHLVRVVFEDNDLAANQMVRVIDDGLGMSSLEAASAFENLGGSWKRLGNGRTRGPEHRLLHGKTGRGRFKAFALGNFVEWRSISAGTAGSRLSLTVTGTRDALNQFRISDSEEVPLETPTGTEVRVVELRNGLRGLRGSAAGQQILEEFAIYLRQYSDVHVEYDGYRLDPAAAIAHEVSYTIPSVVLDDGRLIEATLDVTEWSFGTKRSLFLCDENGFVLEESTQTLPVGPANYSAHLRSPYIRELEERHTLGLEHTEPGLADLIASVKSVLRDHVRRRAAALAADAVQEWKKQKVYPYVGDAASPLELAERQVFDLIALSVRDHLPSFSGTGPQQQKLTFRLIRQALERDPSALQTILTEVLGLPDKEREEFADLLKRTSLGQIISASRLVTERLDFLRGLEILVFDTEVKKVLRERTQLHRILESHTWLFGEQYHLTLSDQSLSEVLAKHLHRLRGTAPKESTEASRLDGSIGIVDLMLSRTLPSPRADEHDHLIVELKAPSQPINLTVLTQAESYAIAVAGDERFLDTNTRWTFWAVSNSITPDARHRTRQRNRPEGLVFDSDDGRVQVWAKTWSQVIDAAKTRLSFFQSQFAYEATTDSALALLRRLHAERLPTILKGDARVVGAEENLSSSSFAAEAT